MPAFDGLAPPADLRARLTHRHSSECSELAAYFGGKLDFAASVDELAFSGTAKDLRVVSADPFLNELLVAHCEEALSHQPTKLGSFRSAVQNAIVPLLPHGKARASAVAKKLGLSQRTLARRLSLEDLTFSDVLESLKGDLARHYLADPGLSISRIAWLLGYQEVSAFTHAFKRWTGKTPRAARGDFGIPTRFCPAAAECPSIARPSAFSAERGIRRPIRASDESIARASARSSQGGPGVPAFAAAFAGRGTLGDRRGGGGALHLVVLNGHHESGCAILKLAVRVMVLPQPESCDFDTTLYSKSLFSSRFLGFERLSIGFTGVESNPARSKSSSSSTYTRSR